MTDYRPEGTACVEVDATAQRVGGQWTVTVSRPQASTRVPKLADAERTARELVARQLGVQPVDVLLRFHLVTRRTWINMS